VLTQSLTPPVLITLGIWIALGVIWFFVRYPVVKRTLAARAAAHGEAESLAGAQAEEPLLHTMDQYAIPKIESFEHPDDVIDPSLARGTNQDRK
jgi:hypothetical protein